MLSRERVARPTLAEVRAALDSAATLASATAIVMPHPSGVAPPLTTTAPHRARGVPLAVWIALPIVFLGGVGGAGYAGWRLSAVAGPSAPAKTATVAETTEISHRATTAMQQRKGPECLQHLDALDKLQPDPRERSTSPTCGWAGGRAVCMMLAGDCEGGKSLQRKIPQLTSIGPTNPEDTLDAMVASYCEGDKLSPRDQVLVASQKLSLVGGGQLSATATDCMRWRDAIRRIGPTLTARSTNDMAKGADVIAQYSTSICLAKAGDCKGAFRIYREEQLRVPWLSPDTSLREEMIRTSYDAQGLHGACVGKR
jgi:uncharacterized Fe-S cluster protein YjdI